MKFWLNILQSHYRQRRWSRLAIDKNSILRWGYCTIIIMGILEVWSPTVLAQPQSLDWVALHCGGWTYISGLSRGWYAERLCFCNYKRWLGSRRIKEVVICQSKTFKILYASVLRYLPEGRSKIKIGLGLICIFLLYVLTNCIVQALFFSFMRIVIITGYCDDPVNLLKIVITILGKM